MNDIPREPAYEPSRPKTPVELPANIGRQPKPAQDEIDFWALAQETSPTARAVVPVERSPRPGREYDGDYYLRGRQTGKSLYENYRWLPELTIPMCRRIVEYCGIGLHETINDFGCARGYVVKALRHLGYEAYGQDISEWAIANADPAVARYLRLSPEPQCADWTIAKDVLEHIPGSLLDFTLCRMVRESRRGLFIVVPLAGDDGRYVVPEYEQDVTHRHRLTLSEWRDLVYGACRQAGGDWEHSYAYLVPGIKDNYRHHERGNGFIVLRRKR